MLAAADYRDLGVESVPAISVRGVAIAHFRANQFGRSPQMTWQGVDPTVQPSGTGCVDVEQAAFAAVLRFGDRAQPRS